MKTFLTIFIAAWIALAVSAALVFYAQDGVPAIPILKMSAQRPRIEAAPAGPIFPFSVIPGGVRSAEHLKQVYPKIDLSRTYKYTVPEDRQAYVGFMLRGVLRWTSHLVTIRAGEQVWTDDHFSFRGRCGNPIEFYWVRVPQTPVPEPFPVTAFDAGVPPVFPPAPESPFFEPALAKLSPPIYPPVYQQYPPVFAPAFAPVGRVTEPVKPVTPVVPVENIITGPFPNKPGQLEPVPEPTSMVLLGSGLIGAALAARKKKK